jgi:hypothetical protein
MSKILLILSVFLTINAWATPARIIIIRHGEKIDDSHNDLSPKGCERAYQLVNFFAEFKADTAAIYAQGVKKMSSSMRPMETIAPIAKLLSLKINNQYLRDDVSSLAHEILTETKYQGKTILVSWEHSAILSLVPALGVELPVTLRDWPSSVFDQAWIVSYKNNDLTTADLKIVAEHVLPTDIENAQSGIQNWGSENSPSSNGIIVPAEIIKNCSAGNQGLDEIVKSTVLKPLPN